MRLDRVSTSGADRHHGQPSAGSSPNSLGAGYARRSVTAFHQRAASLPACSSLGMLMGRRARAMTRRPTSHIATTAPRSSAAALFAVRAPSGASATARASWTYFFFERPDSILSEETTTSVFQCRLRQCQVPPNPDSVADALARFAWVQGKRPGVAGLSTDLPQFAPSAGSRRDVDQRRRASTCSMSASRPARSSSLR